MASRSTAQARAPLTDAAAVNATRRALYAAVADTGLRYEASSAGRTRYRARQRIPKAACGGAVATLGGWHNPSSGLMGARGNCRRLNPRGLRRGYCLGSLKASKPARWCGPRRQKATRPQSTSDESPFAPAALSQRALAAPSTPNTHGKLLHRADRYGDAWRPALPRPAEAGGHKRGRLG